MKPARFDYVAAASAEEALEALAQEGGNARILAGGQSLLPMLNMRLARPTVLIDIMGVDEWRAVDRDGDVLRIGAAVRQVALEQDPDLARFQPLLAAALPWVGHPQTRSRGTVCGSIAHADPSAELPLVLVALGGTVHLRSRRRKRVLSAQNFFTGMMSTAREDDELIEAIALPKARTRTGYAFREVARRHGDFAIVACAAVVNGVRAQLAVGGVADRPALCELPAPGAAGLDEALDDFAWSLEARDDLHATARYRRELVRRLGRTTLEEAVRCRA
ncbi:MAG: FAD binding domain-containing protein [Alphaproteobacteria bacterium]|nr:FAD binding domain-containing protein [Alphaproteobacteria bacterium]